MEAQGQTLGTRTGNKQKMSNSMSGLVRLGAVSLEWMSP